MEFIPAHKLKLLWNFCLIRQRGQVILVPIGSSYFVEVVR